MLHSRYWGCSCRSFTVKVTETILKFKHTYAYTYVLPIGRKSSDILSRAKKAKPNKFLLLFCKWNFIIEQSFHLNEVCFHTFSSLYQLPVALVMTQFILAFVNIRKRYQTLCRTVTYIPVDCMYV